MTIALHAERLEGNAQTFWDAALDKTIMGDTVSIFCPCLLCTFPIILIFILPMHVDHLKTNLNFSSFPSSFCISLLFSLCLFSSLPPVSPALFCTAPFSFLISNSFFPPSFHPSSILSPCLPPTSLYCYPLTDIEFSLHVAVTTSCLSCSLFCSYNSSMSLATMYAHTHYTVTYTH